MRKDKYFLDSLERIKTLLSRLNFKGTVYLFGSSVREDYKKLPILTLRYLQAIRN
jgi:predicted nucleotidyltransferase